ncbi:hypothetical protein BI364_12070 [Acidihalobacter yilgarnensis]|uniref:Transporter n=1 Tax=Acidihalobacter yilgarnensis TaxID=2819280 RepID=A0A1D8IQ82_9GAMM|nr:TolC family protein [Acidihalobacter yilgarnensis]AOU98596.1 hypothetical protein BI364_12070 [Acidihalobacter yilgarnensis]
MIGILSDGRASGRCSLLALALLVSAFAPASAADQEDATGSAALGFEQAMRMALAQTPQMLTARAQLDEARGGVREARGHLLPRLSASLTAMGSDNPLNVFGMKLSQGNATFNDFGANQFLGPQSLTTAPNNLNNPGWYRNYQPKLSLQIPIYNGGQAWGGLAQARAYLAAAQLGDAAARQHLLFEVLGAYVGVGAAQAFVGVAQKGIAAADAYVTLSEKLFGQGVVSKSDLLRAKLHLTNARLQGEEARNALEDQRAHLRMLVGLPADAPLRLSQRIRVSLPAMDLGKLRQQGVGANPRVQAQMFQVEAAQAGVEVARASYMPHFNVEISREWNSPSLNGGRPSYTVAGVLSWNLFDFGARGGALDGAEARVMQRQAQAREVREKTELAVGKAWREVRLAAERVSARNQAIGEATEAERLAQLRYEKGVSTIAELLAAQTELDKARSQLVAARYQAVMARAGLLLALGQLHMTALKAQPATAL